MRNSRKTKPWFRRERLVWGWCPITWQGWVVILIYLCVLLYGSWLLLPHNRFEQPESLKLLFWLMFLVLYMLSLIITIWRTSRKTDTLELKEEESEESDDPEN